jgi:hypothetical protein
MKTIFHLTRIRLFLLLLPAALMFACTPTTPETANQADVELITLERQACFGFCPIYTLGVHGDGRVDYSGHLAHPQRRHDEAHRALLR